MRLQVKNRRVLSDNGITKSLITERRIIHKMVRHTLIFAATIFNVCMNPL